MFGDPFYNAHIRTTSLVFGTLFDKIYVIRREQDNDVINQVKVPIAYGPKKKFLARLDERKNLDDPVKAITLPRLAFEQTGITYDSTRMKNKFSTCNKLTDSDDPNKRVILEQGVPYTIGFDLHILTNTRDDANQIIEQILPHFNPSITVKTNPIEDLGTDFVQNIRYKITGVNVNDDYTGDFEVMRRIETTISFEASIYFLKDVTNSSSVIKTAIVNLLDDDTSQNFKSISYAVTPTTATVDDSYTITISETLGYDEGV